MKIHKEKIQVATKVLKALEKVLKYPKYKDMGKDLRIGELYLKAFANGREQGFCLEAHTNRSFEIIRICFAEHRSSDNIVVYAGLMYADDPEFGDGPSHEMYKNGKHFSSEAFDAAAEYIADWIANTLGYKPVEKPIRTKVMKANHEPEIILVPIEDDFPIDEE
jgi:hypothetical protein